jgi:adenine-specific DNA-methyltransferase
MTILASRLAGSPRSARGALIGDDGDISWPGGGGARYEVLHPVTGKPCKVPKGGWVYSKPEKFWEEVEAGRVAFGEDETTLPRQVRFLFEGDGQVMRSVNYSYAQTATMEFVELMGGRVFDNPKNWRDIARLVAYMTKADDIVVDFFAGSGTTGHATFSQNVHDGGCRRFILVQLPEPLDPTKKDHAMAIEFCQQIGADATIASVTKERLRRAAATLRGRQDAAASDLGFRVFKLDFSNIEAWEPNRDDLNGSLTDAIEHLRGDRTEEDILFELLLKLGLKLTVPIDTTNIAGKTVYSVGAGTLLACLDESVGQADIETLGLGIAAWHAKLAPAGETTVVFRDRRIRR